MTDGLTLPRAESRSRRRRLPRPPKFTRWQKFCLAFNALAVLANLIAFFTADRHLYSLLGASVGVALIHAIVLDALRPPFGGFRSFLLALPLIAATLVCCVLGI